jgi:hypothetical protein
MATQAGFELESSEYRPESETYRFEYDHDTTPPSMAAVAALSEAMDLDPVELEPIQATVDADAIDTLLAARSSTDGDVHVTWTTEEYDVTIYRYGVIAVAPSGDDRPGYRNEGGLAG